MASLHDYTVWLVQFQGEGSRMRAQHTNGTHNRRRIFSAGGQHPAGQRASVTANQRPSGSEKAKFFIP
jgi:hypothetical protein